MLLITNTSKLLLKENKDPVYTFTMFAGLKNIKTVGHRQFSVTSAVNGRALKEKRFLVVRDRIHLRPTEARKTQKDAQIRYANNHLNVGTVLFRKAIPRPKNKDIPDYYYGESSFYKESNYGLYGGYFPYVALKEHKSKAKTKLIRKPNVVVKHLYSETLDKKLKLKVVMQVYQDIQREGGLDNYLTKDCSTRIKELGPKGWELRCKVLKQQALTEQELFKNEDNVVVDIHGKKHKAYFELGPYKFAVPKQKIIDDIVSIKTINDASFTADSINDDNLISLLKELDIPLEHYIIKTFSVDMDAISNELEKATISL